MKRNLKIMVVAVAALAILFTFSNTAHAQSGPKLGIGLNLGAPTDDAYSFAIGGDLRYQLDVDKQLSVPITAGYTNFSIKDKFGGGSIGFIPVKAGLKYFFNPSGAGAYGLAEVGAGFGTSDGMGTAFVFSPAIGYAWSSGVDLAAKYEGYSKNGTAGYVGLRLAYGFKL
ncbi:hypothetical protein [Pedobacter montanisoli]|uniref:Outer membrane protein beta-barrel domain-containing protein n=1 Tax=Pedobacter montanisoli TaxID=2923277 RepID=A0ABS9ZY20_9SPHI|nr:hypothetical protein [Pedobacter montanisoli]MCJ0743195.1 hypothetical protein [Pedobacter montanisoli]